MNPYRVQQPRKIPVFYSFHYANDVMRVQQIRNIGALDGNQPVSPNEWEQVKRNGDQSVRNWINENLKYKRCVIVLVGEHTSKEPLNNPLKSLQIQD